MQRSVEPMKNPRVHTLDVNGDCVLDNFHCYQQETEILQQEEVIKGSLCEGEAPEQD